MKWWEEQQQKAKRVIVVDDGPKPTTLIEVLRAIEHQLKRLADAASANTEIAKRIDALTERLDKGEKLKSEVDRQHRRS